MKTKRILAIVLVLAMVLSLAPMAFAEGSDTSYSAKLCVNWWKYDYQTVSGEGVYTFTLDVSDLDEIQYVALIVDDAYADLKDYSAYVQLKLDGEVLYNGSLTTWAQWVDDGTGTYVETNNYCAEPFNLWGGTNVVSSMPTGTTLEVKLGIGQVIVEGGDEPTATYVVAGDAALCGSAWDSSDSNNLMTDEDGDGVYTKVYENVADGWPNFKVVEILPDGTQNWLTDQEDKTWNMWLETKEGDTVTITYEPATGIFTYVSETPSTPATYVVAGEAALCGSEWDATDANNQMTDEDGDGVYTKVYTYVAAGWPQFKVVELLPDGTQNWLTDQPESWNMWVETKKGDTVTITYEPATGKITYTVTTPPVLRETAYLCCAEKVTWWPCVDMKTDVQVSTVVTGEGTYTLSWNLNEWGWDTVDGIQVLYIDITNYENLYMYDATNITVTADGEEVPTAWYNAKTYNADGYYRIELYNVYSNSAGVVSSDLTFAENLTVTFDLVKGQPSTGDTTPVALAVCLLVLGALGVTALVVTKKKLA